MCIGGLALFFLICEQLIEALIYIYIYIYIFVKNKFHWRLIMKLGYQGLKWFHLYKIFCSLVLGDDNDGQYYIALSIVIISYQEKEEKR